MTDQAKLERKRLTYWDPADGERLRKLLPELYKALEDKTAEDAAFKRMEESLESKPTPEDLTPEKWNAYLEAENRRTEQRDQLKNMPRPSARRFYRLKDALEYIIPPTHTFTVEVDGYRYFVSWRTPSFSHSGVALEELRRVPLEVEEEEAS